jgi:hypothetical protein
MRLLTIILILVTLVSFGQDRNPVKLGLGIIAIENTYDESKIVTIYKDKDFKIKIEDFKLYGDLKNIWPYYFKPDYGLCYFVCIEKTKTYYRILINDKEEGFLKSDNNNYFKTWESILINSIVERLDLKSNPLKSKPSYNAETITLQNGITLDRLQVVDVIEINGENWIHVNFSKSGEIRCVKGTADCAEGWVKWKSGEKLLVTILLLC